MTTNTLAGVSAVADILATLGERDHCTVSEVCERHGIPRSTAFQVVQKMLAAGLVAKHGKGQLTLGPLGVRLAYAGAGLAALAGPAEAAMAWLRDETGGHVALLTSGQVANKLVSIPDVAFECDMQTPVSDHEGREVALIQLLCPTGSTLADRDYAISCCRRVAMTLEGFLRAPEDMT